MSDDDLRDATRELHADALLAMEGGRVDWFRDVSHAYREVLGAFPRAWARYGLKLDEGLVRGPGLFQYGAIDGVVSDLYEQMRLAAQMPNREFAAILAGLPFGVAVDTVDYGSTGLVAKMGDVLVNGYLIGHGGAVGSSAAILAGHCSNHLLQLVDLIFAPRIEKSELKLADRLDAAEATRALFLSISALLKGLIDEADEAEFSRIDDEWSDPLRTFYPEVHAPVPALIERMVEEYGADDPRTKNAEAASADVAELVAARDSLLQIRSLHRIGLLMWTIHKSAAPHGLPAHAVIFRKLRSHFSDAPGFSSLMGRALRAEFDDHVPWSIWFSAELPSGRVHTIPTQEKLLAAYAVNLMTLVSPDSAGPALPAEEWISDYRDRIATSIESASGDAELMSFLSIDKAPDRGATVFQMVSRAADGWRQIQRERDREAPLNPDKVERFRTSLISAWRDNSLVRPLLRYGGPSARPVRKLKGLEGQYGLDPLIPKELFVATSRVVGIEMNAADIGLELVSFEEDQLMDRLSSAPSLRTRQSEPFRSVVERALSVVRANEDDKTCILLPLSAWRAVDTLGLRINFGPTPDPPADLGTNAGISNWYQGEFLRSPVLTLRGVPEDKAFVINLPRFLSWTSLEIEGEEMLVQLVDFDQVSAEALAHDQPKLYVDKVGEDIDARVARIREQVHLHVRGRLVIRVADRRGGRWVRVPDSLRQ